MLDLIRAAAQRVRDEPVLVRSVIGGGIALLAIFGITVNDSGLDSVIDVIGLLAGILVNATARQVVTPTAKA